MKYFILYDSYKVKTISPCINYNAKAYCLYQSSENRFKKPHNLTISRFLIKQFRKVHPGDSIINIIPKI